MLLFGFRVFKEMLCTFLFRKETHEKKSAPITEHRRYAFARLPSDLALGVLWGQNFYCFTELLFR